MRRSGALGAALLVAACASGTAPAPPQPAVSEPVSVTDPRVSELRILVMELVDRMEVMQSRLSRMEDLLSALTEEPAPAAAPVTERQLSKPEQRAAIERYLTAAEAADLYRDAILEFGRGQNNEARKHFTEVLKADPQGQLADNALYWIAETHFVMNEFREAIRFYDRVALEFPSQNKAPDALHRKALALAKLGDLSLARQTLESLIERYPYSTAASAARRELERLRY